MDEDAVPWADGGHIVTGQARDVRTCSTSFDPSHHSPDLSAWPRLAVVALPWQAGGPVPLCSSNSISLFFVSLIHGHHATLIVTRRLGVHATQGHEKFASGGMLELTT